MKKVEIYSTPTCHYCHMAKDFFEENKITYTEYNVAKDLEKRKEMLNLTNQMGVPVIVIDGDWAVGFNETEIAKKLELV
jgi:glutaredoxin 3